MASEDTKKNCLVIGAGKSGKGAAALLLKKGESVILFDENKNLDIDAVRSSFKEDDDIKVIKGELPEEILDTVSLAVLSPGVPLENKNVQRLNSLKIPVSGEIELAFRYGKGDVLAITGTNGKTTTTTLLGDIMKNYAEAEGKGRKVFVVGNIGDPYTLYADEMEDDSITVAEISSFQLETISEFKPKISAILNVTPDHLNRHHTMENYAAAKKRICKNQTTGDAVVLNYDDPLTRDMAAGQSADIVYFTREENVSLGNLKADLVQEKGGKVYFNDREILSLDKVKLLGGHNYENIMAAVGMAVKYGVPDEVIRDTVSNFTAVEHRIEYVETINGVDYFNDSKGTNPDASIKAIEAMVKPTILIGGGYDKKNSYDEFIEAFKNKVKCLVLIGETAEEIRECAFRHGFNACIMAGSLRDAVKICHRNAAPGDAVLLSPACASWDMFKDYEERGRLFKEYVREL